jgi:hypothetical protein
MIEIGTLSASSAHASQMTDALTTRNHSMPTSRLANAALILAPLGWLLASYGVLSQMGDPAPGVTREALQELHRTSTTAWAIGVAAIATALWLSGHVYATARRRSILAALLVVVPAVVVCFGL